MAEFTRESLENAPADMWRYAPWLPAVSPRNIVSMGEGWTPLIRLRSFSQVWIKEEGSNPLGWAARGASCAASVARESGWSRAALPTDPQAAIACAAYCAAARVQTVAAEPTPECRLFGTATAPDGEDLTAAFHAGSLTLAYEIAEQFDWSPPPSVVVPPGCNAALLTEGFERLVQERFLSTVPTVRSAAPVALHLLVDRALEVAAAEGLLLAPQTAACLVDLPEDEITVVINPSSGLRELERFLRRFPPPPAAAAKLGGLITPR